MWHLWERKRRQPVDYTTLINDLQDDDVETIRRHLAFHDSISYLDSTVAMMRKMRRPEQEHRSLSLHRNITEGDFELVIFHVPWETDIPYRPLILHRESGAVYGIMLPFNELQNCLSKRQQTAIGKLSVNWVSFTIDQHFRTG